MTTTPDSPLGDDEITTEGVDPTGVPGRLPSTDADGTDGARRRRHRRRLHRRSTTTDGDSTDATARTAPTPTARTPRGTDGTDGSALLSALDLLTGDAQVFLDTTWASSVHVHRTDPDLGARTLALVGRRPPADRDRDPGACGPGRPQRIGAAGRRPSRAGAAWPASRSPAWSIR